MKLIFLDIDGTLTRPGENVPPESALDAVRKAQEAGNKVFLCSGRNYDMLKKLLKYGFDGIVAASGGYVMYGDEVLYDHPMTESQCKTALDILHRNGVFCTIEAVTGTWGDENMDEFIKNQPEGNSEIERWRKSLSSNLGIRPMSEYNGSPVHKLVFMCLDTSQIAEAKEKLGNDFNFVLQESRSRGYVNGEMINQSFNKGTGIQIIAKHLGVPMENTYGFGDSMNDLEMLEVVGTGVCMENSPRALTDICNMICPSVEKDGIAWAFERLRLNI